MTSRNSPIQKVTSPPAQLDHDESVDSEREASKFNFLEFLKYSGPGWLAVVAYIDPGNMYADIAAGASFAYSQLWVIFWASVISWLALAVCSIYGIYARQHLAKAFRESYPKWVNWAMWFWVEIVVIATDIPEVIGFAYACNIFFGWRLWIGVVASFVTTMLFLLVLAFERGYRILELVVSVLVGAMCVLLIVELAMTGANLKQLYFGWFVPQIWSGSIFNMIGIVGAVVMPHNLFLLTGVAQTRIPRGRAQTRKIVLYSKIEPILPLCISWICNLAIVALAAQNVFPLTCPSGLTENPTGTCAAGDVIHDPPLDPESVTLLNFCQFFTSTGSSGCALWALALLAAAQASAMTTTFTGSFVMDGFVDIQVPLWVRSIGTRVIAITPAVIIAAVIGTPEGLNRVIGVVNVVLGLALPMCLVPLVKLSHSTAKMGMYSIGRTYYSAAMGFSVFLIMFNALTFFPAESWTESSVGRKVFAFVGATLYVAVCSYFVVKEPAVSTCAPLAELDYVTEDDTEEIDLGAVGMSI